MLLADKIGSVWPSFETFATVLATLVVAAAVGLFCFLAGRMGLEERRADRLAVLERAQKAAELAKMVAERERLFDQVAPVVDGLDDPTVNIGSQWWYRQIVESLVARNGKRASDV